MNYHYGLYTYLQELAINSVQDQEIEQRFIEINRTSHAIRFFLETTIGLVHSLRFVSVKIPELTVTLVLLKLLFFEGTPKAIHMFQEKLA